MQGIRKAFPGVLANDDVDFQLQAGEIHALLGENGAGKSTLMSVLMGLYRPDAGSVAIRGQPVRMGSPRQAVALGLGMVHQHFVQSERHTALENIVLGHPELGFLARMDDLREQVRQASQRYGLQLELDSPLHALPVGERQKVEIVRALFHGASILVLDEPTAVLSRQETAQLFEVLRSFCAEGGAVVFISHKLDEVLEISHRITVLRQGRGVATVQAGGLDVEALAELMVGRELAYQRRQERTAEGAEVARLERVSIAGPGEQAALRDISFALHGGEILGMAGVSGSGQAALADLLAGLARPSAGTLRLFGQPAQAGTPRAFRDLGVAYVPEDRLRTGIAGTLRLTENAILKCYRQRFTKGGLLRWRAAQDWCRSLITRHDIQCSGHRARAAELSGGNIQKLILARELSQKREGEAFPRLLVAAYPCRGLDIGAAEDVRAALLAAREGGSAVLLFSEDLDELFRLSDRIGVLFRGRLLGLRPAGELRREQVGLMMGGHPLSQQGGAL